MTSGPTFHTLQQTPNNTNSIMLEIFCHVMEEKRGYISRALSGTDKIIRESVAAADHVIEGAVETGRPVAEEVGKIGDQIGRDVTSASKSGAKMVMNGVGGVTGSVKGNDAVETLERLGYLWKEGLITDQEFQDVKRRLLARI